MVYLVKLTDRQLNTLRLGADPLNYPLAPDEVTALRDVLQSLESPLMLQGDEALALDRALKAGGTPELLRLRQLFGQ